jgi:hypothetical protein
MDFYNTLYYLVGPVGPHITTFVTFSHLTSAGLSTSNSSLKICPAYTIDCFWEHISTAKAQWFICRFTMISETTYRWPHAHADPSLHFPSYSSVFWIIPSGRSVGRVNLCRFSSAQSILFSGPVGTHDHTFAFSETYIYIFWNGASSWTRRGVCLLLVTPPLLGMTLADTYSLTGPLLHTYTSPRLLSDLGVQNRSHQWTSYMYIYIYIYMHMREQADTHVCMLFVYVCYGRTEL